MKQQASPWLIGPVLGLIALAVILFCVLPGTKPHVESPIPSTESPITSVPEDPDPSVVPIPTEEEDSVYYSNCSEVRKDHPRGITRSDPGYRRSLDRDHDGRACDK